MRKRLAGNKLVEKGVFFFEVFVGEGVELLDRGGGVVGVDLSAVGVGHRRGPDLVGRGRGDDPGGVGVL